MLTVVKEAEIVSSVAAALQFISYYHPQDFIEQMVRAYEMEESTSARNAIAQILVNSRMAALGRRPICQDTGTANIFIRVGMDVCIDSRRSLQEIIDEGVRTAYRSDDNPLRASVVFDPIYSRRNSGDNTPAMVHVELVAGDRMEFEVSAKGGGSENKAKFAVLEPSDSISDWVVNTVEALGAGWCPPGILGIGVGGSVEKSMLMAKQVLNEKLDMQELMDRGPADRLEELRIEIYDRVNALGVGAQGLGGLTTVLDVKIRSFPTHAASLPVALVPNCAATRHVHFTLDGNGPATFMPPDLQSWPQIVLDQTSQAAIPVDLDNISDEAMSCWKPGDTLLLSGTLFTGRDAAHQRMTEAIGRGEALPVDLHGKAIYYVGPVNPVGAEVIGPAGPTTATRMDRFLATLLPATGLKVMIGKAERGPDAIRTIAENGTVYLIAVGGAAYLVSKAVQSAEVVAYADLGMEAIYRLTVKDMPVTVAVDCRGNSIHVIGPARFRR